MRAQTPRFAPLVLGFVRTVNNEKLRKVVSRFHQVDHEFDLRRISAHDDSVGIGFDKFVHSCGQVGFVRLDELCDALQDPIK